jgi:hypothetical protein
MASQYITAFWTGLIDALVGNLSRTSFWNYLEINRTAWIALKVHELSATCGTSAGTFKRRPVGHLGDANCKERSVISTLKREEVCWRH